MTLPRIYGLTQYWRDHPPLHILIGAFLGVKPATKPETKENVDQMIGDFMAAGLRMGST